MPRQQQARTGGHSGRILAVQHWPLLLSLTLLAHPGWAQQPNPEDEVTGAAPANASEENKPDPTEPEPELSAEEREEANRVREAINENLVPERPSADDETRVDDSELPPAPAPEVPEATPGADDTPADEVAEEFLWERFAGIATRLQAVPERIPPLAGKGWIHFGRVEFEGARFSKGTLQNDSGFNFRSLRGGLLRQWNDNLLVKLEVDLTDGDSNFTDLYGRYN